jgi:hypothetical protein
MKNLKLLPNRCKKVGWLIFIPSLIWGLIMIIFEINFEDFKIHLPVFLILDCFRKAVSFKLLKLIG